jgi:anti-sigma regulatory factor (Ser/Thr protein kinase)
MLCQQPAFTLVIPSDLKLIPLARTFVETVCCFFECDPCFMDALQLATHEALQNIIRHAHHNCCHTLLEIQAWPRPDGLELRLLDEGQPFDVASVPHLEPGELRIGGRGVYMMRRLVDELSSEARQPRGNILRMVKHFRASHRRQFA